MGGVLHTKASSDVSFVIVKNVLAAKYKVLLKIMVYFSFSFKILVFLVPCLLNSSLLYVSMHHNYACHESLGNTRAFPFVLLSRIVMCYVYSS